MARLAVTIFEDSGDELPDLTAVFQRHGTLTKVKAKRTGSKDSAAAAASTKARSKIPPSDEDSEAENQRVTVTHQTIQVARTSDPERALKPKTRKRILKPASDNPRLLSKGNINKSSTMPNIMQESLIAEADLKSKASRQRPTRKVSSPARASKCSDWEDDPFNDGSDGISDFIVDDDDSFSETDSDFEMPPPPKSTRKLVRGRRPEYRSPELDGSSPRQQLEEELENAAKASTEQHKKSPKEESVSTITDLMNFIDLATSEDEAPKQPTLSRPRMQPPKSEIPRPSTAGSTSGFDEPLPNLRL